MSLPPVEIPLGAMRFNSDSQKLEYWNGSVWFQIQTFSPNLDGGARGIFMGGHNPSSLDRIDFITISSAGDAIDFGNLTDARTAAAACASNIRALQLGGTGPANVDTVDFITISSTGDAQDFGNLTAARHWTQGCSSKTRGVAAGGNPGTNRIDYCTIASTGDFQDFGDLTYRDDTAVAANSSNQSPTRGFLVEELQRIIIQLII